MCFHNCISVEPPNSYERLAVFSLSAVQLYNLSGTRMKQEIQLCKLFWVSQDIAVTSGSVQGTSVCHLNCQELFPEQICSVLLIELPSHSFKFRFHN